MAHNQTREHNTECFIKLAGQYQHGPSPVAIKHKVCQRLQSPVFPNKPRTSSDLDPPVSHGYDELALDTVSTAFKFLSIERIRCSSCLLRKSKARCARFHHAKVGIPPRASIPVAISASSRVAIYKFCLSQAAASSYFFHPGPLPCCSSDSAPVTS